MAIDNGFISDLKFRCPVDEVIGSYVTLKRAGSRYVACCPFHNEKTPSFTVFPDTSSYYCFGCGAGGDVITFVMKRENLDYVDAVRLLAERAGMRMPEDDGRSSERRRTRERMLEMHRLAARHYYENLTAPDSPGLAYLKSRGITAKTATRFGLGYAKDSFDDLKNLLLNGGFTLQEAFAAGLLAKSQKNGSFYDKFRDRLMFPVIDLRGNVIAFSGRALSSEVPQKYMNSPDTDIYRKGAVVFGLNLAKNEGDTLIMCEGNVDVVMLAQAGFKNAVAPLGTAFTVDQARVLARYAKTVVLAFDNDGAGRKATEKAIDFLRSTGVTVRVLQMQGAKDPDEYIKTFGRERFELLVNRSKTPTEYRMDKLRESYDTEDTAQKMQYVAACCDVIAALPSAVEREIYAVNLSKELGVSFETVRADVERRRKRMEQTEKKRTVETERREAAGSTDRVNAQRRDNLLASRAEETLIVILCRDPGLLDFITERITPEEFVTDFNREVYRFVTESLSADSGVQSISFNGRFDEQQCSRITYLLNTAVLSERHREQAEDCIETIKSQGNRKIDASQLDADKLMSLIKKEKRDEH